MRKRNERNNKKNKREIKENYFPTAKNRTGFLPSRVTGQLLYHDVFSIYMRHFDRNDIYPLKDVIQDIMTTSSSLPKRCTIGPLAQFNSMVSSWTTRGDLTGWAKILVKNLTLTVLVRCSLFIAFLD
jgi:hypothetical protein